MSARVRVRPFVFSFVAAACGMSSATPARADCAATANYVTAVSGNTVNIALEATSRTCPDSSGMLRQNEATGEVDLLPSYCVGSAYGSAYVDECVPPGTYRYGLALPYSCTEAGCSGTLSLFKEATVAAPLDPSCARASGDPGPTVTNETPPWEVAGQVQPTKSCPGHGGCACDTATATVVSMNAFSLGVGALVMAIAARRRHKKG